MPLTQKTHKDPFGIADTVHELSALAETGTAIEVKDADIKCIIIETNHASANYIKIWDSPNPDIDTDPPDFMIPIIGLTTKRVISGTFTDCTTSGIFLLATATKNSGNSSANITHNAPNGTVNVWVVTSPS